MSTQPTPSYTIFDRPNVPARLLVVDDDALTRDILTHYLKHEGYIVASAPNGAEGLARLDEFTPDILCLDYMMPDMTGHDVARQLRARNDLLYVPIVMLTASGDNLKLDSLESGVDAFLTKPVSRAELKITIRTLLRMKRAQDTMLAALDRVAEVQDALSEMERQHTKTTTQQQTLAVCALELYGPLSIATAAAAHLDTDNDVQQEHIARLRLALEQVNGVVQRMRDAAE